MLEQILFQYYYNEHSELFENNTIMVIGPREAPSIPLIWMWVLG